MRDCPLSPLKGPCGRSPLVQQRSADAWTHRLTIGLPLLLLLFSLATVGIATISTTGVTFLINSTRTPDAALRSAIVSPVIFAAAYTCTDGGTITNGMVISDLASDITGCTLEGSLQFTTAATSLPASPQYAAAKYFTLRNSFTSANGGPSPRTYIRFTGLTANTTVTTATATAAGEGGAGPVTILVEGNDLTSRNLLLMGPSLSTLTSLSPATRCASQTANGPMR